MAVVAESVKEASEALEVAVMVSDWEVVVAATLAEET